MGNEKFLFFPTSFKLCLLAASNAWKFSCSLCILIEYSMVYTLVYSNYQVIIARDYEDITFVIIANTIQNNTKKHKFINTNCTFKKHLLLHPAGMVDNSDSVQSISYHHTSRETGRGGDGEMWKTPMWNNRMRQKLSFTSVYCY